MMLGWLRSGSLPLVSLAVAAAMTAGSPGCSTTKPTELVPGVTSQVVVPRDLQAVRVTVLANGETVFDQGYDVGPSSTVQLPSTLGVVSGPSAQTIVTITVRGYNTLCAQSDDCNNLGDAPVGDSGARILRRSIQTFVDQHTLFVPMPLSYSCWNTDCGATGMGCKGNQCLSSQTLSASLVDFDPSLVDGTGECFSPQQCFGDQPDAGKNATIAPLVLDAGQCLYAFPGPPTGSLNVRVYYQNFTWQKNSAGEYEPSLNTGGEQEILNLDPDEGFTLVSSADAGASEAGASTSQTVFKLAPGLCKLAQAASNPPPPPPTGASTYVTISDLRVANLCPPKPPLLPICAGEQATGPGLPAGGTTTDQMCNVAVNLVPTQSALYIGMDHSAVMHGAFGPTGAATTLSLSLGDPVFKRTYAAFDFLRGQSSDCTSASTSFAMPDIDFGIALTVQEQIAEKLAGWSMSDSEADPNPLDLQAALRLDSGVYSKVVDFLKDKEPPNIAAAMFFLNRVPDTTNDCNPPLGGQPSVQAAIESEIRAAFDNTPSLQTYFVVLDDDAHDTSSPTGALTFFNQVRSDLPQAVQVLDATQTSTMAAAQTAAANFSKLVTQLGTCVYDYALPQGTQASTLQVAFAAPGVGQTVVPADQNCSDANQNDVDGWSFDGGRLRICGKPCTDLRQAILASAAAELQSGQPAQDVPVTATILCSGTSPASDAGPTFDASTVAEAGTVDSGTMGTMGFMDASSVASEGGAQSGGDAAGVSGTDSATTPPIDASMTTVDASTTIDAGSTMFDSGTTSVPETGTLDLDASPSPFEDARTETDFDVETFPGIETGTPPILDASSPPFIDTGVEFIDGGVEALQ